MPLTPSHVAAVLPLARTRLSLAALAIGSMAPDVPLFTGLDIYRHTHSVVGALTTDVALGLPLYVLWRGLLRAPTLACLPSALRARWPAWQPWRETLPWVLLGLALGACTHVAWDHCTHAYGAAVHAIDALRATWPPFGRPGYAVLQAFSSLFGGGAVVAWLWTRRAVVPRTAPLARDGVLWAGWAALLVASVALAATRATLLGGEFALFRTITGTGAAIVVLATAAALLLRPRLGRGGDGPDDATAPA